MIPSARRLSITQNEDIDLVFWLVCVVLHVLLYSIRNDQSGRQQY